MRIILLLILALFLFSCRKKDESLPIGIEVRLLDDVSPVVGELSISGEYDYVDWNISDSYKPSDYSPNPAVFVFREPGPAKVNVVAYKNDSRQMFSGESVVEIPGIAKKIKIYGFRFRNNSDLNPYDGKPISISLTYDNPSTIVVSNITIPSRNYSPSDSVFLPEPVVFDISGFENGNMNDYDLFVTINSGQEKDLEFLSSFNLTGKYMFEHPWNPGLIQTGNVKQNLVPEVFILCDWMPR
ncbi:MAG: hypothetical protein U0X39_05910 [Bacteroidales bacterium]